MKRYFALFLTFILIFNFVSFSYADTIDNLINVNPDVSDGLSAENTQNDSDDEISDLTVKDSGSGWGILSFLIDLFIAIGSAITEPLYLLVYVFPTIDGVIFNHQSYFKISIFDTNPVGIVASVQGYISAVYNALRYLVVAVYIVVLVYLAVRVMFSAIGRQKARYKELFRHWLVGLLLLFSFHWIMAFIIWLSNTFVQIIADFATNLVTDIALDSTLSFLAHSPLVDKYPITTFIVTRINCIGIELIKVGGVSLLLIKTIISIITIFFLLWQTWSIVVTYLKRLFTICILVLLFPLVALSYVFDKIGDRRAQTFEMWLKEFVTNVAIQPIHALVLLFIATLFSTSSNTATSLLLGRTTLGGIMTFAILRLIPIGEDLIKRLFQIGSNMGPGSHGIAGSMAHAGMALNSAKSMIGNIAKKGAGFKDLYRHNQLKRSLSGALNNNNNPTAKKTANDMLKASEDTLKARYGSKSLAGIGAKTSLNLMSAMAGVATAVTGSGTGRFTADALSRADAYSSAMTAVTTDLPKSVHELKNGNEEKAKEFGDLLDKLNNPDKMTKDDMKKLSVLLGLDLSTVENAFRNPKDAKNANMIKQWQHSVNEMNSLAKWGDNSLKLEDIKKQNTTAKRAESIRNGINPDTGDALNCNDYEFIGTGNNTLIKNKKTGEEVIYNNKGFSSLAEGQRIVLDPSLKGTSAEEKLHFLEQTKIDASTKAERAKAAMKKARSKLDKLEKTSSTDSSEYLAAELEFTAANSAYNEAVMTLRSAEKNVSIAEKESEMFKAIDQVAVSAGAEPTFTETALKMVQDDLSKGSFSKSGNNVEVTLASGSTYTMKTTPRYDSELSEIYVAEHRIDAAQAKLSEADTLVDIASVNLENAESKYNENPTDLQAKKGFKDAQKKFSDAQKTMADAQKNLAVAYSDYDKAIQQYDTSYFPSAVKLDTATMRQVGEVVRTDVFNSNPKLEEQIKNLNSEYYEALTITDPERRNQTIAQISTKLNAAEAEYSTQYNAKVQKYVASPSSAPTDSGIDISAVFSAVSDATKITNSKGTNSSASLGAIPEAVDQFAYGVCQDLTEYLNEHSDRPTIVSLVYVDDNTLSVKTTDEGDETNISTTPEVISNIFGNNYLPVTIYSRNGSWYKK